MAKQIHFNRVQQKALAVFARLMVFVCGRGMGKSQYITGIWLLMNMLKMPRSGGGLIVPSYSGMEKITNKIYEGWEMMGYREWTPETGGHYVINKRPPDMWPKGYNAPKSSFKHYVSFYNGSGYYYLSAKAAHNGADMDFLGVEEAKLVKHDKYRETAMAVRGNESKFGHLSCHGSRLIVSDMPRADEGDHDWFMEWSEDHDQQGVEMILACQQLIQSARTQLQEEPGKRRTAKLVKEIKEAESVMNEIRKHITCYVEADSLENILALGPDYFLNREKDTEPLELLTSILNKPVKKVKGGFYPVFSEERHGYKTPENEGFTDCRKDTDLWVQQPIDIACDYNNAISSLIAGQLQDTTYRFVNELYVLEPYFITDLARKFVKYYQPHEKKIANYYIDPTALQGKNALSGKTYYEEFTAILRKGGWTVNIIYQKQATTHADRYKFWHKLLRGALPVNFGYNAHNCEYLPISMGKAGAITKSDGTIAKDKRSEKDKKLDQRKTTHLSEAADGLIMGRLYKDIGKTAGFVDVN